MPRRSDSRRRSRSGRSPSRGSPSRSPRRRSRSRSPEKPERGDGLGIAEVVDGAPRPSTGEPTWRTEILMPQGSGGYNYAGKVRTMCIRGPTRVDKEQAKRDAERLQKAADGGDAKTVKAAANEMLRGGDRVP
uniref:Uncharacterized protein n=1 Tax=Noctiluca scintillans TaxID=2966 RepID=A0A7S1FCF3_NOCSC|mmetsp:Transcript_49828/g.132246  ORF Transcript_49828/g.132246 Transcript_49828/m.132246 type:complete len:133 (+) Transcript_49828:57-455(+)